MSEETAESEPALSAPPSMSTRCSLRSSATAAEPSTDTAPPETPQTCALAVAVPYAPSSSAPVTLSRSALPPRMRAMFLV